MSVDYIRISATSFLCLFMVHAYLCYLGIKALSLSEIIDMVRMDMKSQSSGRYGKVAAYVTDELLLLLFLLLLIILLKLCFCLFVCLFVCLLFNVTTSTSVFAVASFCYIHSSSQTTLVSQPPFQKHLDRTVDRFVSVTARS